MAVARRAWPASLDDVRPVVIDRAVLPNFTVSAVAWTKPEPVKDRAEARVPLVAVGVAEAELMVSVPEAVLMGGLVASLSEAVWAPADRAGTVNVPTSVLAVPARLLVFPAPVNVTLIPPTVSAKPLALSLNPLVTATTVVPAGAVDG